MGLGHELAGRHPKPQGFDAAEGAERVDGCGAGLLEKQMAQGRKDDKAQERRLHETTHELGARDLAAAGAGGSSGHQFFSFVGALAGAQGAWLFVAARVAGECEEVVWGRCGSLVAALTSGAGSNKTRQVVEY